MQLTPLFLQLFVIVLIFFNLNTQLEVFAGFGLWNKFSAKDTQCITHNVKLLSLLNLLCNSTQTTSVQMRDACYGCFFRAGSTTNGLAQLTSLNECARLYIANNTEYRECSDNLQSNINGVNASPGSIPIGYCYTGYCEFVRCVRRINARKLIASCFNENFLNRNLSSDINRINFYTNVTSCILSRARCSEYNPISGEFQNQSYANVNKYSWLGNSPSYFNSLQFSDSGELRIISFPATTNFGNLFCSATSFMQQSSYGTFVC